MSPALPMTTAKLRQLAWIWGVSLALSAALAGAGARWPDPLPPRADVALALVLLPPLALAAWLLRRRHRSGDGRGGESLSTRESAAAEQETH